MTYIKTTGGSPRLQILTTAQSPNTLAAPLAVPATNIDQEVIHRTLTTAATDFLFSANQTGRGVVMAFSNDNASTVNMTISAQASETIAGPVTTLNPVTAQTYVLQPGESLTLANTGTAAWTEVV